MRFHGGASRNHIEINGELTLNRLLNGWDALTRNDESGVANRIDVLFTTVVTVHPDCPNVSGVVLIAFSTEFEFNLDVTPG
jgi:hypothetical protein